MTHEREPDGVDSPEDQPQEGDGQEQGDAQPDVSILKEELEEALREKDQFRAMAQRAQADLINYRRRADEEQEELQRSGNARLLLKTLTIADDIERALSMIPDDSKAQGWLEGLQLVLRNVNNIFESEGLSRIEAEGKPFEPREHEAVFYQEVQEGDEGVVISVVREGYKLHDKVLRATQVVVSKSPEQENSSENTEQEAQ